MDPFNDLLSALDDYLTARQTLNKAYAAYTGVSPGYALQAERSAWENSATELKTALDAYVLTLVSDMKPWLAPPHQPDAESQED